MEVFSGIQCLGLLPKLLSLHQRLQGFLGASAILVKVRTNRAKIGFVSCPSKLLSDYLFLLVKKDFFIIAPGLKKCLFGNAERRAMEHIHLHIGLLSQIGLRIKEQGRKDSLAKGSHTQKIFQKA
jgi:hypothetical protein